jgi:hypothetical protein
MSDKSKNRAAESRGQAAAAASRGIVEPDVVDFLPLPVYPLLGTQVHCVRWQVIVEGMKKKGLIVRVHKASDRGGLFKAASRVNVKLTSRQCAGQDGQPSWLVRVAEARGGHAADIDAADPTASDRGRYRALSLLVLERGFLVVKGREVATAMHRSLREFIREQGLAGRRRRNAVVVTEEAGGGLRVAVAAAVRDAYAELGRKRTSAA